MFFALSVNVLTVLGVFCIILNTRYEIDIVYLLWAGIAVLQFFVFDKKKYRELERRYKEEKNGKLKGWLVFAYVVVSFILYFISTYFMYQN